MMADAIVIEMLPSPNPSPLFSLRDSEPLTRITPMQFQQTFDDQTLHHCYTRT